MVSIACDEYRIANKVVVTAVCVNRHNQKSNKTFCRVCLCMRTRVFVARFRIEMMMENSRIERNRTDTHTQGPVLFLLNQTKLKNVFINKVDVSVNLCTVYSILM